MDLYLFLVIILFFLGISDLVVGVSNDAVNFLNSAIGSRVASRKVIMAVASIGILFGVTFSSGMMEVARKGIFHPEKFVMPELMAIFLSVMLANIILFDLYNTLGLPTSTTVAIVFALLGAALAVSWIKIYQQGENLSELINYINTAKALAIISGILISIVVAFTFGVIIQFITRLVFTFDFTRRFKRYGAIWGGAALTFITYFILIKGAKGSTFITQETLTWIHDHTGLIMVVNFVAWTILLQFFLWFTRVNILKFIILVGTLALAMAFAANDLVNFIGVPLAGFSAFKIIHASGADPLNTPMNALAQPVQSNPLILLASGIIMVVTLVFSKKARTVTRTEINLGRQEEGEERFGSTLISRVIVRQSIQLYETLKKITPKPWRQAIARRFDQSQAQMELGEDGMVPAFDHLRASVNLMVASALISFATSLKLPLSTTYVTFMVAMGTSLADRAWGRESAVYRVTGVLTVIGGWFFTAFLASAVAMLFAVLIYFFKLPAIIILLGFAVFLVVRSSKLHKVREELEEIEARPLARASNAAEAFDEMFVNISTFFSNLASTIEEVFEGIFVQDRKRLKKAYKDAKKLQRMVDKMVTHLFKTLLLPDDERSNGISPRLAHTIGSLQEMGRHITLLSEQCLTHVENNHKPLLDVQVEELREIEKRVCKLLKRASSALQNKDSSRISKLVANGHDLESAIMDLDKKQIKRIKKGTAKTRASILYLSILTHANELADHTLGLVTGCSETLQTLEKKEKSK